MTQDAAKRAEEAFHTAYVVWRSEVDNVPNQDRLVYLQKQYVAMAIDAAVAEAVKEQRIADAHEWNRRLTGGLSSFLDPQRLIEMHDWRIEHEARREERERWTGRLVEISADLTDLIAASRTPDSPPARAPEGA